MDAIVSILRNDATFCAFVYQYPHQRGKRDSLVEVILQIFGGFSRGHGLLSSS